MTLELEINKELKILFTAFCKHTGYAPSSVGAMVARDGGFYFTLPTKRVRRETKRQIIERFSFLWPDCLIWPNEIERYEPIELDEYMKKSGEKYRQIIQKKLKRMRKGDVDKFLENRWYDGVKWPSDIPKPTKEL